MTQKDWDAIKKRNKILIYIYIRGRVRVRERERERDGVLIKGEKEVS